ncbi:MAG TPA: hypothetical protein VKT72_18410 [Candidatus Baltobacteraceae bacterium]|nr:hypothetical protein [Candidatus Baltobacteraceae bacterium]
MKALLASLLLAALPALAIAGSFGDLHYRWIGPAVMGGRLDAVAGVPGNPKIVYLGHASAGLWKSTDGGLSFASSFEAGKSSAVGAIAIDPHNPQHVYIGTGEAFPRNTADYGDGIWVTSDGAEHWKRLGLERSGSIAKIAISPRDSRIVLAAAIGHEFAPGGERGIYRSTDGGEHWTRVLYVNETTGGSDLAFDPKHPNVVYAGMFDFLRRPWTLRSGGAGSGLYKSYDAGKTWVRLTDPRLHNGLPAGPINRVGVSVCYGNPNVVYAFVPVKNGLLYRSTDAGAHWQLRNSSQDVDFRPFYFSQVRCDPSNPQKVYAIAGPLLVSSDGGLKFHDAGGGGDNHDLWIDPLDPQRLLNGSDMGFHYSVNGGKTWNYDDVVPFSQVYRVGYDMDTPYHVMGGMQDHEVWRGPNELLTQDDGPSNGDWLHISDWGDGQYAMADPRDPDIIYEDTHFGDLVRANLRTGERRYISPQPIIGFGTGASTYPYRFNWSAPLLLSHFNPDVVYFGGNVLFRSADQGQTWSIVSPDLTHCNPAQLAPSGGPISLDDTNAETYCTIYSIGEDAKDPQTIWYGTDNGHLEVTRNDGKSWSDVITNVRGLPLPARVASISPSAVTPGTAYAAFDRHQWNDYATYAYVTRDYGATWQSITGGLESYVHVVREDPRNTSVLYAGTERGVFVSFDAGAHWTDFRLGLPHIPIFDLQIHPRDNDLILGSHGRGFYVLDDLTPLQHWSAAGGGAPYLFAPMPALRYAAAAATHWHGRGAFVSENKPYGALFTLYLPSAPKPATPKAKPSVHVRITDTSGREIAAFDTQVHTGINRLAWDLDTELPAGTPTAQDRRSYYIFYPMTITGGQALPGSYTAHISVLGTQVDAPVTVQLDPHNKATMQDLQAQFSALQSLGVTQARTEALMARLERAHKTCSGAAALLDRLRNPEPSGYRRPAELSEQIAYLRYIIGQYDGGPTQVQQQLIDRYAMQFVQIEREAARTCP